MEKLQPKAGVPGQVVIRQGKMVHQSISSARGRFSRHFCSDRFTFYRQETVGMIWRGPVLQRLSHMANAHANTVTEYCLFHLSMGNE